MPEGLCPAKRDRKVGEKEDLMQLTVTCEKCYLDMDERVCVRACKTTICFLHKSGLVMELRSASWSFWFDLDPPGISSQLVVKNPADLCIAF